MPLLMCPNCNESMQEVRRNDVQIDMCPRCRGVWLNRGELEKLLHAVDDQYERERTTWAGPSAPPAGGYPHHQPHYKRKKKNRCSKPSTSSRAWLEPLIADHPEPGVLLARRFTSGKPGALQTSPCAVPWAHPFRPHNQ